jgi:hypothetical protein
MLYLFKWLMLPVFCSSFAYAQEPQPYDIVINEILFNPAKDGYDYVEGYNRSRKTIDLAGVLIASRNATNDISGVKPISKNPLLLGPDSYFVITSNEKWLKQNYSVALTSVVCQVATLPSFPDDEGTVILLTNKDSLIIDELKYSAKWHFPFITDASGVALERINDESPAQDKDNWTSASSASGHGTPGYQNSQFRADLQAKGEVIVSPRNFSPDNNGMNDFAFIQLHMKEPGYVANVIIYDISGRRVRYLIRNEILGISNTYKWDGYDDGSQKLPTGVYMICTGIFNLEGRTKKFRHQIVLNNQHN